MHCRWHRLIEERQFVILDVDNLKLRVLAAFQDIVHPLCDGRGFPSRSRTAHDDSNFQHFPLSPFWCDPQVGLTHSIDARKRNPWRSFRDHVDQTPLSWDSPIPSLGSRYLYIEIDAQTCCEDTAF